MPAVDLSNLKRDAVRRADCVAIYGADELVRDSALRAIDLLASKPLSLSRLLAEELTAKPWSEIESLSPNGLFGSPDTFVIDRIGAAHKDKIAPWLETLSNADTKPQLILSLAVAKLDAKLETQLPEGVLLVAASRAATSEDVLTALSTKHLDAPPKPLIDAMHSVARRHSGLEIEAALRLTLLALDDPSSEDAASVFSRLLAGAGQDAEAVTAILRGDEAGALSAFASEIRTTSEMSGLLARLPYALNRAAADAKRQSWRDIQKSDLAIRRQNPLARSMVERALLRIARRQSSARR